MVSLPETLYSAAVRAEARKIRRAQLTWRVAYKLALFAIVPFIVPILFFLCLNRAGMNPFGKEITPIVVVCYAIYISSILALYYIVKRVDENSRNSLELLKQRNQDFSNAIDKKLGTTIQTLLGLDQIHLAITDSYEMAILFKEKNGSNEGEESDVLKMLKVRYFGGANISPNEDQNVRDKPDDEKSATPSERYLAAVNSLKKANIPIERYVRLFEDDENSSLISRSKDIQKDYSDWLIGQIKMISENANYSLFDSRRAPRFKSITNFIITPNSYINIVGAGQSGFRVFGKEFIKTIRDYTQNYIYETSEY